MLLRNVLKVEVIVLVKCARLVAFHENIIQPKTLLLLLNFVL